MTRKIADSPAPARNTGNDDRHSPKLRTSIPESRALRQIHRRPIPAPPYPWSALATPRIRTVRRPHIPLSPGAWSLSARRTVHAKDLARTQDAGAAAWVVALPTPNRRTNSSRAEPGEFLRNRNSRGASPGGGKKKNGKTVSSSLVSMLTRPEQAGGSGDPALLKTNKPAPSRGGWSGRPS